MFDIDSSLFSAFRAPPGPTLYGQFRSAVTSDVVEIALIVAFGTVLFSVILSSIGIPDGKKRLSSVVSASIACYFFICILLAIFGYGWRVGSLHTETQYKAFTNATVHAKVGLNVGLYSVNITMKGEPTKQLSEEIDYNEHFNFGQLQGRFGFGSQAGLVSREFREGQARGLPYPILWVIEYFTLDGELIRWGRQYRQAGYYTAILMWSALAFFFLTVMTASWTLAYSACLSCTTGILMILACVTYDQLYSSVGPQLKIPFEDGVLETAYGWSFYLTLANGLLLCWLGFVMMMLYLFFPDTVLTLFGIDLDETDEILLVEDEPTEQPQEESQGEANEEQQREQQRTESGALGGRPSCVFVKGRDDSMAGGFANVIQDLASSRNRTTRRSVRTQSGFTIKRKQRTVRTRAGSSSDPELQVATTPSLEKLKRGNISLAAIQQSSTDTLLSYTNPSCSTIQEL
ncbi:dual oxidase maturation factor 1-like [Sycon ciliatum]|uniref:dual oxidase maturation factor 1-like n=1 Tax=Sycon ciliatum TaxID=27933 RepID=UPI0020AA717A|eukprot:scpid74491/ scgid29922/ Dual oxidase maturation factor 1; Dual oxidase activator 1; Numb-interacting protein